MKYHRKSTRHLQFIILLINLKNFVKFVLIMNLRMIKNVHIKNKKIKNKVYLNLNIQVLPFIS